ncbi:hypothetical protein J2X97_000857 [Epilithonimonas hungarica]|nr:hypothetical protein [Epilithonimonas hungarica]
MIVFCLEILFRPLSLLILSKPKDCMNFSLQSFNVSNIPKSAMMPNIWKIPVWAVDNGIIYFILPR